MKKTIPALIALSLLGCVCVGNTVAGGKEPSVESFTNMQKYIKEGMEKSTLVVMDNDDTLTTMSCPDRSKPDTCQYLGGAAWFDWQQEQIENMSQPRVADTFTGLLDISAALFSINYMPYSAKDVPGVLDTLTDKGVRLLVETARGDANIAATEAQFQRLSIDNQEGDTLFSLISSHSLTFGNNSSKASPYQPCPEQKLRAISYRNGAMYLAGQNKGIILKCMLDEYNAQEGVEPITHVIFIDDTEGNVKNVREAFAGSKTYNIHALHYTALSEHKKAFTDGRMADTYQENAMQRWHAISHILRHKLPSSLSLPRHHMPGLHIC